MAGFLSKIASKIRRKDDELFEEADKSYVELNTPTGSGEDSGLIVRPFVLTDFNDVKEIVDTFREGNMIAMINIAPLKEKDMIELKRAINKIKKTCDAIEGDLAGIGENYLVATPKFVKIFRGQSRPSAKKAESSEEDLE